MKEVFAIARRFLRSVHLARDCGARTGISGYIVTPTVRSALLRMVHGFRRGRVDRAFAITGPYGSGKSSLALFLFHLTHAPSGKAWDLLRKTDSELARDCIRSFWSGKSSCGYAFLPATAGRQSMQSLLADAVDSFGKVPSPVVGLSRELRSSRDAKTAVGLIEKIADEFCKAGYRGIVFGLDELGLAFDNARLHPGETDVSILQELAEVAARREDASLVLLGIMHQGFADYAASDPALHREFGKIGGRFNTITFAESPSVQMQLVAEAIDCRSGTENKEKRLLSKAIESGLPSLVGLSGEEFRRHAAHARPLHPLALAALPILFRRLGQNERSVFTYLVGNEPDGFQDIQDRHRGEARPISLDDLYDYLFTNFEAQLSRNSFGQAILEAHDVLARKSSLSPMDARLVKTVAILSSLGSQSRICATEELIRLAIAPESFDRNLGNLQAASILVFRKFSRTYALWNGSDIDLRECEKRADEELSKTGFSIAETLSRFVPPEPLVAKKHSLETGTLRFFETRYLDRPSDLHRLALAPEASAAGLIVVCLPEHESELERFIKDAKTVFKEEPRILFAIPAGCAELKDALKEIRRLHWIGNNVHALRDDRVASREVAVRLAEAMQLVSQRRAGLLDPRKPPLGSSCVFVHAGRKLDSVGDGRALSRELSLICDGIYPDSPRVRNELINRRSPSSQAASARNKLVSLINNPEACKLPLLGIPGYPPERSIYESVFLASGMHVRGEDGEWRLAAPRGNTPTNLLPAWKKLESIVMDAPGKPVTIREIYDELRRPPYGMLDGLLPLLVIVFYLVNRDEVFLYQEGSFLPEPTDAQFELLVRRPELFAISGMKITGTRAAIVKRLAAGLGTGSETVMPVVRKLYALRNSLSKYARETDSVSDTAKAFRKAFEDAKSPEVLLFRTLPAVFGLPDLDAARFDRAQLDRYFAGLNGCLHELGNALPALVSESRKQLLSSFGFENTPDGWRLLYDRCCYLLARIGSSDLVPFLQNVKNTDGDWSKAAQVLAYVVQSPMDKWGPLQQGEFAKAVVGFAERFAAAWRPYDGTVALSPKEAKAADALLARIRATAQKAEASVLRAALLRALAELDVKG